MAKIPPEKIAEVRDRVRLEEWVGRTVQLQKRGRRWVGLCPFHSEKSPSFGVSPDKQLFHCFGCGTGGDLFGYVMRIEGLEFPAAVRHVAAAVGVELPEDRPTSPADRKREAHRESLYSANAVAQEIFREALEEAPDAMEYLVQTRGLSPESIERFEIGWAPPSWSHLSDGLAKAGLPPDVGLELGLLGRRARDGKPYDRLRGRITFPIRIPGGRIAGFGARRADWVDPDGPKYLNSPESPIYDKSKVLYGLSLARDEIRKARQALLVEGYLDVIVLAQAGFTHVLAGCGTALTAAHAKVLGRLTDEVLTLYDGDLAGRKATHRAAELLLASGTEVRVVPMPEGQDPDDLVREQGAEAVGERLTAAPSAIDFFLSRARAVAAGGGVAGTRKAVEAVRPLLSAIADPLARDVAFDACARELGIDKTTFRRHLSRRGPTNAHQPRRDLSHSRGVETHTQERPSAPLPHIVETELLKMLLEAPDQVLPVLESERAHHAFRSEPVRAAVRAADEARRDGRTLNGPEALEVMRSAGLTHEPWLADVRARLVRDEEPEAHEVQALVTRLLEQDRKARRQELRERLARCTDVDEQLRLLEEDRRLQSGER